MRRRDILQTVGAGGIALTMTGTGSAAASEGSKESKGIVEMEEVEGRDLVKLKQDVMSNRKVKRLIQEASKMGWRSRWTEMKAVTKTIKTDEGSGTIDTAVITFDNLGQGRRKGNGGKDDGNQEMYLHYDVNVDEEVRSFLKGGNSEPEIIHIERDSTTGIKSESTDSRNSPEITVYNIGDEGLQSHNVASRDSQANLNSAQLTTESTEYCDVNVRVLEKASGISPCYDVQCILTVATGSVITVISCLKSGGLLCLGGFGVSYASAIDCLQCEAIYQGTISVERSWIEEYGHGDNPCTHYDTGSDQHYMLLTKCELEAAPTEEDFNFPDCYV